MSSVTKPIMLNETGEQIVQALAEVAESNKSYELLLNTKADKVDVSAPFNFKGTTTYAKLPTSGNTINDTYYCEDKLCRYTWNGEGWYQSSMNEVDYTDELAQMAKDITDIDSKLSSEIANVNEDLNGLADITTDMEYAQVQDSELKIHNGEGQLFLYEQSNPKQIALDSSLTFCPYTIGCEVTEGESIKVIGMSYFDSYTGVGIVFSTSENDIPVWSWANGLPAVDTSLYDVYGGNTEEAWRSFEYEVVVPVGAKMVWVKGQSSEGTKIYKKTKATFKAYSKEEANLLFVKQNESGYEEGVHSMRNKPTVIFDFDQTTYDNRAAILKERGFSATFAVNPTDTEANKRLVLDGFDLSPYQGLASGSYGSDLTRPTDYTDVTAWRNFIGNLIEKCERLGIYKPISYSCYGHKGGSAIDTVCKEFGIKYVRCGALYGADGETVTEYVKVRTTPDIYHKFPYPMEMHTVDETKEAIDSTITDGNKEIVLMCHKVDGGEGHLSEADFISIVDYVKAKHDAGLVNVLNFHQYYALWYPNENAHDDYCRLLRASMS